MTWPATVLLNRVLYLPGDVRYSGGIPYLTLCASASLSSGKTIGTVIYRTLPLSSHASTVFWAKVYRFLQQYQITGNLYR